MQKKDITLIPYSESHHDLTVTLIEEFYQYLIHIDPLKRLVIKPNYGEKELQKILAETSQDGLFLLAQDSDGLAGFVTVAIYHQTPEDLLGTVPSTIARLTNLYVSALNRQQGLGTLLLHQAEDYAKSKNCDVMKIEVFAPNEPARKFYAKHGYEIRELDHIKKL